MKEFKRKLIVKSERLETPEDNLPFGGNCVIVEYRDWYKLFLKVILWLR